VSLASVPRVDLFFQFSIFDLYSVHIYCIDQHQAIERKKMLIASAALLLLLSDPSVAERRVSSSGCCFVNHSRHRSLLPLMSPSISSNVQNNSNTIKIICSSNCSSSNKKQRHQRILASPLSSSYVNMPPYGTIRKFTILSSSMDNNMMMDDGYYNINNNANYRDDRWQKKMKSRMNRVADPIIQDFGTKDDWDANKHGLGWKKGGE
jgi:hypothetical protein